MPSTRMSADAIIVPHRMIYWSLTGGLLHLVQRGGTAGAADRPGSSMYQMYKSPPVNGQCITVLMYNGPLLCGFYVPIKG